MKTATGNSAPFSYAPTKSLNNELIVWDPDDVHLYIGNDRRYVGNTVFTRKSATSFV